MSEEELSRSVTASVHAVSTIEASSMQQVVGVDQIGSAMVSIEQAVHQNLVGFSQLESASRRLEELGAELKRLVESYRV